MPMKTIAAAFVLMVLAMPAARADPLRDEIAHLLDFIRSSSCTFIRNEEEHSGKAAADHIEDKYDYYRDEIKTVEDFIERAASRSSMSGKPYQVRCDGKTMPAADWLRGEHANYQATH